MIVTGRSGERNSRNTKILKGIQETPKPYFLTPYLEVVWPHL